ncbi:MAG TPA: flagellar basal-body MS-ring/collar protein FliF [Fervidobacterium sp.]|nr:flagellar M-ring protein FliF [Fervidobacterium sp.]NLH37491.1 flagellar M-ring protein FliF [Thermotogaceae bacterium]MBP8656844.1 flagellar M-ring protein FliF [Fervidobacterium sp.]MBP9517753.1 flagellar M-ring protein FliF [Fervidobacterium sp.]HOK33944.1 flagellar basal-body MS-ring/collar protein FliF [Fervidobacterium sp.]
MEWFRKVLDWFAKIPEWWKKTTKGQKLIIIMVAVSVVVAAILLAVLNAPKYVLLLTTKNEQDAGTIIQQLDQLGIPYQIDAGNRILIPSDYNVYEVRMKLASAGVLSGSSQGFEILDQTSLGATSFDKQVRYQIALQGELERTISTIQGVQSARVVLTLPKYTYYVRGEMSEPRASVMVVMNVGMSLTKEQVSGIISLVQGSVEGIKAENIKIVDQTGKNLSEALNLDDSTMMASTKMELKMNLENYYKQKIKTPLENIFGAGRVEVIPDVKLNWERVEKQITTYTAPNRNTGLIRSQETEQEISTTQPTSGGAVGTESNIPPTTYETVEGSNSTNYQKSHEIINYELNQIVENVVQNSEGEIENIAVSVVIDSSSTVLENTPKDQVESLINSIIEKSIDANTPEGSVTYAVAFLPFSQEIQQQFYQESQTMADLQKTRTRLVLLFLAAVLIFFATYLGLIQYRKVRSRRLMQERYKALQEQAQRTIESISQEEVIPGAEEESLMEQLKTYLQQVADTVPEDVATVLKVWISEKG